MLPKGREVTPQEFLFQARTQGVLGLAEQGASRFAGVGLYAVREATSK